jgi:hypothetical protein
MAKIPDKKVSAFIVPRDAKVFLLVKNKKKTRFVFPTKLLYLFSDLFILI